MSWFPNIGRTNYGFNLSSFGVTFNNTPPNRTLPSKFDYTPTYTPPASTAATPIHRPAFTPAYQGLSPQRPAFSKRDTEQKLEQLQELKALLDDPTTPQALLITKYRQCNESLKAMLGAIIWACHYMPLNEPNFGERLLDNDMRILKKINNQDNIDIVSQLISHYSNQIEASKLIDEVNEFIRNASNDPTNPYNLRPSFNALSNQAKEGLRHKVWFSHGGHSNGHFGGLGYGSDKIEAKPLVLWDRYYNSQDSIVTAYLTGLQEKRDGSDAALLENLKAAHRLDKAFDTSISTLQNKKDLIKSLPEKTRAVFVSAELGGVASIGGLGAALEGMVRGFGEQRSRVIMPLYENGPIKAEIMNHLVKADYEISAGGKNLTILKPSRWARETYLKGIHVYFIQDPHGLFWINPKEDGTSGNFYEGSHPVWANNHQALNYQQTRSRWAVFQKGAAELCYRFSKKEHPFELVHAHDAQSALTVKFLKEAHLEEWRNGKTPATVFTFHNNQEPMVYESKEDVDYLAQLGLARQPVNSFIEGLCDAEVVTTVSKQFAREAQEERDGKGMEHYVRRAAHEGKVFGITNGNSNGWNPAKSTQLQNWTSVLPGTRGTKVDLRFDYDMTSQELAGKLKTIQQELCAYLKQLGPEHPAYADLDPEKPIVFYVGRYDSSQKGVDKLKLIMEETLARGGQFICVGAEPDPDAAQTLDEMRSIARNRSHKGVLILEDRKKDGAFIYQSVFGDLLRYGCTLAAFPSKYEPCGLVQGELLKGGKKIIATKTGGFIDTLKTEGPDANAYLFDRDAHWGFRNYPSAKQDEAIRVTVRKALEEAHQQQQAFYHGTPEEVEKYTRAISKRMEDANDSTWTTTPDGSLSPARQYQLAYAEAFERRKVRDKMSANLTTLRV
jgi:glycogen synthase